MLRGKFKERLITSMHGKDAIATATMRLITAALKDRDIAARSKGNSEGISNDEILAMLATMIKQRRDSILMFTKGGRDELAQREAHEIEIIEEFLPKQLTVDEVSVAVDQVIENSQASGLKDMGKVMGVLKNDYAGQMDFGRASGMVKEKLAAIA